MKKIIILIILLLTINIKAEYNSKNILLYNKTKDQIIINQNKDQTIYLADIEKIMAVIITIENSRDLNLKITITDTMLKNPNNYALAPLKKGEIYTIEDLLYITILRSAEDAKCALIESNFTESEYVEKLNKKAKELGMNNTIFTSSKENSSKSTLEDILILLKYTYNNQYLKKILNTKKYTTTNNKQIENKIIQIARDNNLDINNLNTLFYIYNKSSGKSMISSFNHYNNEYILITTNAEFYNNTYIKDHINIYNEINKKYNNYKIIDKNQKLKIIPVKNSNILYYELISSKDIYYYTDNLDESKINIKYNGIKNLSYKNNLNDKIGKIEIYYDNNLIEILEYNLKTQFKFSLFGLIYTNIYIILSITLTILVITIYIIIKNKKKKNIN